MTLNDSINRHDSMYVKLSDELTVYAVWYPEKDCYITIRKLTPKECFRLQGWDDESFSKAEMMCSSRQLYRQAGNGVTVNVIRDISQRMKCIND